MFSFMNRKGLPGSQALSKAIVWYRYAFYSWNQPDRHRPAVGSFKLHQSLPHKISSLHRLSFRRSSLPLPGTFDYIEVTHVT
jgi:hypothetical protein